MATEARNPIDVIEINESGEAILHKYFYRLFLAPVTTGWPRVVTSYHDWTTSVTRLIEWLANGRPIGFSLSSIVRS